MISFFRKHVLLTVRPVLAAPAGISAASGISADLGIPLTHRGLATSVRFVTGHLRKEAENLPEAEFILPGAPADPHTTLVVYMGLSTLPTWSQQLQVGTMWHQSLVSANCTVTQYV